MHRRHHGGSLRALTSRGIFDANDRCAMIARSAAHTLHDQQSQDREHENCVFYYRMHSSLQLFAVDPPCAHAESQ